MINHCSVREHECLKNLTLYSTSSSTCCHNVQITHENDVTLYHKISMLTVLFLVANKFDLNITVGIPYNNSLW